MFKTNQPKETMTKYTINLEGRELNLSIADIKRKILNIDNVWTTKDFIDGNDNLPMPLFTWLNQLVEEQEGVYYANKQSNHDYYAQENRISNDPEIK